MPYSGPIFTRIPEVTLAELELKGGFSKCRSPLLVKGAISKWPASQEWTFERLAQLKRRDGSAVIAKFQNGLVEQGVTRRPIFQPISGYLRDLAQQSRTVAAVSHTDRGLLPDDRFRSLQPGEGFHLNWSYLTTFPVDRIYLALWYILDEFPELRQHFDIQSLWKGRRWTWEYVFMGPAETVTGLHTDTSDNWFCQVQGTKEVMLFSPENDPYLHRSRKYDWGATLSEINIAKLETQTEVHESFAKARGLYVRLEAGDALFVPKNTWHGVVALEPSISLAIFGQSLHEIVVHGPASETRRLLHRFGLYRRGNCTCHNMTADGKIRLRDEVENLE